MGLKLQRRHDSTGSTAVVFTLQPPHPKVSQHETTEVRHTTTALRKQKNNAVNPFQVHALPTTAELGTFNL